MLVETLPPSRSGVFNRGGCVPVTANARCFAGSFVFQEIGARILWIVSNAQGSALIAKSNTESKGAQSHRIIS